MFATNLVAVIRRDADRHHEKFSVNAWANRHKLVQSTINRVATGAQDPSTEMIEKIAAAADLEPWQMFVPEMDPQNPPVMYHSKDEQLKFIAKLKKVIVETEEILDAGNTRPGALIDADGPAATPVPAAAAADKTVHTKPATIARGVSGGLGRKLGSGRVNKDRKGSGA